LTPSQWTDLSDPPGRTVYIAFDQDENHAGQKASHQLALRLQNAGARARIIQLPRGHDPNSFFVDGATAADFTACIEQARRP
jgi:DNA primase